MVLNRVICFHWHGKVGMKSPRSVARKIGLGHAYLRAQQLRRLGVGNKIRLERAKAEHLSRVRQAEPISMPAPSFEVHMLLQHGRVDEALWALYSLAQQSEFHFWPVIHDDGTLTRTDGILLKHIFPNTQIVDRRTADEVVSGYFERNGLPLCARLRGGYVMAMKLFDLQFFSRTDQIILLDSDVLFFHPTTELNLPSDGSHPFPLYSLDHRSNYSLSDDQLRRLLGRPCIERFNPGVLRTSPAVLDFTHIEAYLKHPSFWRADGSPDYFAEMTLWAMELTHAHAQPLSDSYAGYAPEVERRQVTSVHYYGGEWYAGSAYYARAIPKLARGIIPPHAGASC